MSYDIYDTTKKDQIIGTNYTVTQQSKEKRDRESMPRRTEIERTKGVERDLVVVMCICAYANMRIWHIQPITFAQQLIRSRPESHNNTRMIKELSAPQWETYQQLYFQR